MSKLIIVVFSLLSLISACVGQVVQTGQCDETIPVVSNFIAADFLGVWYDIESLPSVFQSGTCNTATYSANNDGSINVQNTQVVGGLLQYVTGTATLTAGTAKFAVSISGAAAVPYWVLATDYDSYALMYSCRNLNANQRQVNSWKLGRNKGTLSTVATNAINTVIASVAALNVASTQFIQRDHSQEGCSYFVDFDGQCPTTVIGVANFEVPRYLGTWYEVARYPQTAQTGQCNRAQYAFGAAGVVNVVNSQVINEALGTISGTATTITGQSGVLQVTFTVGGELRTQNLYVLATDYDNYALVYSCDNLEGNRRRIGSWQLRRNTNPLDQTALNAINNAIAATPDLEAVYYQETSQTDAACFYYPEFEQLPSVIELPGPCNTSITGIANFDVTRYLGTWYEVARYPQPTQTGQCNRAQYALGAAGVVSVLNSQVINEALGTISGTAALTDQSGVLQVTFIVGGEPRTQNLYVLATDYDNFALAYTCTNIEGNRRQVGSWKLSRSTNPLSVDANNVINNVVTATQGLRQDYYQETSQTDAACFYYPVFEQPPATIELPGPCNTSITGVANFDANRYLGTWYEVARYPQTAQTGQCNRAQYALGAATGVVSVVNSQVTNEALGTISGTATVIPGQSGVLQVAFTVGGELRTQNLYVLATDYDNYALVYSCVNIEGNRRQVGSWKLSRSTNPLSVDANNVINNVVTATQGLRQDYYQETSQTDAACFYYPVFEQLPAIIELPGSCNTSITGFANFDVSRYLGTWYEVARYPQPTQTGQCNRAQYALGAAGVVSVLNSQVINEALGTISGTATAVTGQSGVLQVAFTVGGELRTQNLYVLATDYDNYALAYTCTNIEGNRRQVGSWKLSRSTNPLSVEANNVINNVVTATQGLRQDYYQETRQTDAACFYYPVFEQPPATIELPGPCNTSITGVANFDVNRYLGTWYEVARYPQTAQTGQCNRAQYTAGTTGAPVSVVNSQVTNEVLGTISGTATAVTGQSGVLQVTFTVGGEIRNQNIYVLATDYDSYALAYTCANIAGNRRQVGSWKLSRSTNPLSVNANNVINNVVAATQGLRQEYYQETSQTDAACWHYLPQTGDKVIIPGQCDTSISGVANINLPVFANSTWYQIQRYDAVGESSCIGSRLSYDESYININSIEVIGDEEKKTEGIARLTTATSGKFTLEMADSEEQEEIYILATDYHGYAIAYSCKNNGTENRQIGAWQLSRGRTMPAAGIAAVDTLVAERREFTRMETYFKTISHAGDCPEPSSAFLFKSSIIVLFVCTVLQLVW